MEVGLVLQETWILITGALGRKGVMSLNPRSLVLVGGIRDWRRKVYLPQQTGLVEGKRTYPSG